MAIFNFGKKNTKTVGREVKSSVKPAILEKSVSPKTKTTSHSGVKHTVLLSPRLTEKGMGRTENAVYCFNVMKLASKKDIAKAFSARYGVSPIKVRVVPVRGKKLTVRGIPGQGSFGKKAYVYAPKGTKIEFV